jgi:hypothetical protein
VCKEVGGGQELEIEKSENTTEKEMKWSSDWQDKYKHVEGVLQLLTIVPHL